MQEFHPSFKLADRLPGDAQIEAVTYLVISQDRNRISARLVKPRPPQGVKKHPGRCYQDHQPYKVRHGLKAEELTNLPSGGPAIYGLPQFT
jgi:hypothetical protein